MGLSFGDKRRLGILFEEALVQRQRLLEVARLAVRLGDVEEQRGERLFLVGGEVLGVDPPLNVITRTLPDARSERSRPPAR